MVAVTFGPVFRALAEAVERKWGAAARYDLEMRTGLVAELSDLWREVGEVAWEMGVTEALVGATPQLRGPRRDIVAKSFIVAVKAARRVAPQAPVVTPLREVGPYERALLALLGPCAGTREAQ